MISAIVSWPRATDYVIFRSRLPELLRNIDELLICFTDQSGIDLSAWVRGNLIDFPQVRCFDINFTDTTAGDWRNRATNYLINSARGDVLLSLEQDFLIKDYDKFFSLCKQALNKHEVIGFEETNRLHPSCLFMTKQSVNYTHRDFSVMGVGKDHFADVSKSLKTQTRTDFQSLGLIATRDYYHMRGLTDNFHASLPYFDLPHFKWYLEECIKTPINKADDWVNKENQTLDYLTQQKIVTESPFML